MHGIFFIFSESKLLDEQRREQKEFEEILQFILNGIILFERPSSAFTTNDHQQGTFDVRQMSSVA